MLLELIAQHLTKNQEIGKVIEVAPSIVSRSIFSVFGSNYQSFDLNPSADGRECDFVADICDIPLDDNSVSLFVALHVLEHVQNDRLAMKEISRVLTPSGMCLLQVPLGKPTEPTLEELIDDEIERIAKYGQTDHVRLYGEDIIERIQESGMLATFISVEDILPEFLLGALGLKDGMKFILSMRNENVLSVNNFEKMINALHNDYKRLDVFCKLIEEEIKLNAT
jgi:predicted SAM-dependent methyltransferase